MDDVFGQCFATAQDDRKAIFGGIGQLELCFEAVDVDIIAFRGRVDGHTGHVQMGLPIGKLARNQQQAQHAVTNAAFDFLRHANVAGVYVDVAKRWHGPNRDRASERVVEHFREKRE